MKPAGPRPTSNKWWENQRRDGQGFDFDVESLQELRREVSVTQTIVSVSQCSEGE